MPHRFETRHHYTQKDQIGLKWSTNITIYYPAAAVQDLFIVIECQTYRTGANMDPENGADICEE